MAVALSTHGMPAERRVRISRADLLSIALLFALLAFGAVLGAPFLDRGPFLPSPTLPWWALAPAFAATEIFVIHYHGNRHARTISLSEFPLLIGLFLAAPPALLLAQFVGGTAAMIFYRRSPALKVAFNVAVQVAEAGTALALFWVLTPVLGGSQPGSWLAACTAAIGGNAIALMSVTLVVGIQDGGLRWRRVLTAAVTGQFMSPISITLALIVVTTLAASLPSAWLLMALGVLLLIAYRAYGSLAERHLKLERLYRFGQVVGNAPEMDEVLGEVLCQARELLAAERAAAVFVASGGGLVARIRLGASGQLTRNEDPPTAEDAWLVDHIFGGGGPLLLPPNTRDADARRWLDARGLRDAVIVPLSGGTGIVGFLAVGDRQGDLRSFEQDDVLLLETVAAHAAVALRNSELVGRLRHDARHDALTGLPNRTQLQRLVAAELDEVAAGRSRGAGVMILDLDEFKEVNDTLGHQQGDKLLVEVGARLTTAVGAAGTVARLGGDEFAVLVPGTADENRVVQIGRRMLHALEHPITLDGLEVEVGASVGVAMAPAHATDTAALLKRADLAMYDAKAANRSLRIYEAALDTADPRRLTLVSELRAALQSGAIQVHTQPKARLRSGEVVGVEALVRWEHPELGWIAPDEFIPIAERSGLIGPLTTRVLDLSLAACAGWRAAGLDLGIAVNLSTRSLHDADLVEEVDRMLRRHGVPADRLTLEITEGSVMADPTRAIAVLHQLRELGVRLSVDDFGTGYSSLSYLQRLPVQEVKIDRSFIAALSQENENVAIVRAIIDLGRHLGLEVVAEGVEDGAISELLDSMNCDLVQGWHLARPMPTDALMPWLAGRATGSRRGGLRAV